MFSSERQAPSGRELQRLPRWRVALRMLQTAWRCGRELVITEAGYYRGKGSHFYEENFVILCAALRKGEEEKEGEHSG